jgi:hypothetical protein
MALAHACTNWTTLVIPTTTLSLSPPHARFCVSAVGVGRGEPAHCIGSLGSEGRCAVVLRDVGVERYPYQCISNTAQIRFLDTDTATRRYRWPYQVSELVPARRGEGGLA